MFEQKSRYSFYENNFAEYLNEVFAHLAMSTFSVDDADRLKLNCYKLLGSVVCKTNEDGWQKGRLTNTN